jgi:hypothetical protein
VQEHVFMRVALVGSTVVSLAIAIAASMIACSSSEPAPAAQEAPNTALPPKDENAPATTQEEQPPPTDPSDASDPDAALDAGTGAGGFGTTEGDAGSRCLATSIRESESNNDLASADQLQAQTLTFCGRITTGDVDFWTFTMPDQVNDFGFNLESTTGQNNLKIEPSADGEPFSFFGQYPFKPGKPYVLKISSKGAPLEYRIGLNINQ